MKQGIFILIGLLIIKILLQVYGIDPVYELHRDEFLHLDQANHLSWGYLSVPPLTSWLSFVIKSLGNSVFWVKFFPAVFGVLTIVLVWFTVKELKGGLLAKTLAASGVLFSVLVRLNMLYQPNSLDVLCWTFIFFLFVKYINSKNYTWLYVAAVVFSLAFLNKYNVLFCGLGLMAAIIISPYRNIFNNRNFWMAALLSALIVLPNIFWQWDNGWPVFYHMKELAETQLVNVGVSDFLTSQFFYFAGSLPLFISSLLAFFTYPPFKKYRLFFWVYLFTILLYILFSGKGYYAIGLYPVYMAFGAVFLENKLKGKLKVACAAIIFLLQLLFFFYSYSFMMPVKKPVEIVAAAETFSKLGMVKWEDGKMHSLPQDFADMQGWKELASIVDSAFDQLPKNENTLVWCDNYGQAGAINYYTKKNIRAVSFSADYVNWFDLSKPVKNIIIIKEAKNADKELIEKDRYFVNSTIVGSIENHYAREKGTTVFLFENAKVNVNNYLQSELNKRRQRIQLAKPADGKNVPVR